MIVAVHQPNYLPWLGYFAKIARADIMVFLDDVQFSKGSYTNRVQIARSGCPVWLTVPVHHNFGATILEVEVARSDVSRSHRDVLAQAYRNARCFKEVWREFETWAEQGTLRLAELNVGLIERIARRLGLEQKFVASSSLSISAGAADERLAAIVASLAPGGTYLSGGGGANYQSEEAFRARGLTLAYSDFRIMPYERSGEPFFPGLSILDALFHVGFDATAALIRP